MAKVVRFHETGGPEVLKIEEIEVPPPGKGEVQIRIHALGLNRAEAMFRRGQYLEEPKLPARLGYEAAGTVAAVGPEVKGFQVGDAVSTIPSFSLNRYGLYGELANAPVHAVTHHPKRRSSGSRMEKGPASCSTRWAAPPLQSWRRPPHSLASCFSTVLSAPSRLHFLCSTCWAAGSRSAATS